VCGNLTVLIARDNRTFECRISPRFLRRVRAEYVTIASHGGMPFGRRPKRINTRHLRFSAPAAFDMR
jgi:hypothetical protein